MVALIDVDSLKRSEAALLAADRHKDEFLAVLAHELRNPLAPLRNVVSLLKSSTLKDADKHRTLDMMERQISTLGRLVDDLLRVARATWSQIELSRERVDVAALVRDVLEQRTAMLSAHNQRRELVLPSAPALVDADPVRLEQIVGNLVDNASKYTPEGGRISVSVEGSRPDVDGGITDEVVIRVRDTGIGIASDKLPHVFDLFMRATHASDRQEYGGLGVGLTLVKKLTELHGGRVEVCSSGLGQGSEFIVRLPARSMGSAAQ